MLVTPAAGGGVVPGGPAGGDLTGFYPNPLVFQASGQGATNPFPFIFGGTTKASIDAANGNAVFGNSGTDGFVRVGVRVGAAVTPAIYMLANGTAPSATNYFAISDGTNVEINCENAAAGAIFFEGATTQMGNFALRNSGGKLHIVNATTDPTTPTGGPDLYAVGGAMKVIGTGGTITTIAPA